MKVLLFTLEYPPFKGGVANYYGNLVDYWPDKSDIFVLHNNENILIKNWLFPKWLPAIWQLCRIIKKEKIEHIIVGHMLPLGIAAYFANKFIKTPYSVILHGMDLTFALKVKRKKIISGKILRKAENIICASSFTAKLAEDFLGCREKIYVVNPGIDISIAHNTQDAALIREKYNLEDKIVLLSLGRLVKRKGVDKVLEALPSAQKAVSSLVYFIAGAGPDENYLRKKAEGIKNVIFLGKIKEDKKWNWLEVCDIFIMPSRDIAGDFEGFGIVYLEASLMGKPVIAGRSGGTEDAVKNGYSGIIVDPQNKESLISAIIKLSQDKDLRENLGRQGKERAVKEFSWQKQATKFLAIINSACALDQNNPLDKGGEGD